MKKDGLILAVIVFHHPLAGRLCFSEQVFNAARLLCQALANHITGR